MATFQGNVRNGFCRMILNNGWRMTGREAMNTGKPGKTTAKGATGKAPLESLVICQRLKGDYDSVCLDGCNHLGI